MCLRMQRERFLYSLSCSCMFRGLCEVLLSANWCFKCPSVERRKLFLYTLKEHLITGIWQTTDTAIVWHSLCQNHLIIVYFFWLVRSKSWKRKKLIFDMMFILVWYRVEYMHVTIWHNSHFQERNHNEKDLPATPSNTVGQNSQFHKLSVTTHLISKAFSRIQN